MAQMIGVEAKQGHTSSLVSENDRNTVHETIFTSAPTLRSKMLQERSNKLQLWLTKITLDYKQGCLVNPEKLEAEKLDSLVLFPGPAGQYSFRLTQWLQVL